MTGVASADGGGLRSLRFILIVALAHAGGVIGYLPLLSLLLPVKVEGVAGAARLDVLTAAVIAGALAASASNVLLGWLSDRAMARGQGRRHGLIAGVVALGLTYAAVAGSATPIAIVVAVAAFQVAINAVLAPLFAIIADEVPDAQKGTVGGLLALGPPLAAAVSAALASSGNVGEGAQLAFVFAAAAVALVPLLLVAPRFATSAPDPDGDTRLLGRDLALAWAARLLLQVAGNVLALYLVYYFESLTSAERAHELVAKVGWLLTSVYLLTVPVSVLAGRWSDQIGRRKPFLVAGAVVAMLGLGIMAVARDWQVGAIGFGLYAVGSSLFLTLHVGFAMLLLPSAAHRGRDLGILNLTNTLPALAGPLLTWLLATPRDFGAVMLALAALSLASGLVILAVRGRR